ncbi:hypothetical protein SBA2_590016 [Acidobacteriia bacterium SbA2]|nr:hypothetical protein SBA2_590016 [Acidobacteriia bacterium SbA2]
MAIAIQELPALIPFEDDGAPARTPNKKQRSLISPAPVTWQQEVVGN